MNNQNGHDDDEQGLDRDTRAIGNQAEGLSRDWSGEPSAERIEELTAYERNKAEDEDEGGGRHSFSGVVIVTGREGMAAAPTFILLEVADHRCKLACL